MVQTRPLYIVTGGSRKKRAFRGGLANVTDATVSAHSRSVPVREACADIVDKVRGNQSFHSA